MAISNLNALDVLKKGLNASVKTAMNEITTDLLRTAQARAPVDSKTLERSGTMKVTSGSKGYEGRVSFRATNRGYNYAKKMDEQTYNLGTKSLAKSASGVRSRFSDTTLKVGTGYLSDTAKQCEKGYQAHVQEELATAIRKNGFK